MKKTLIVSVLFLLLVPAVVFAEGDQNQQRVQSQNPGIRTASPIPQMNQNQNQVQVQNQGEETQVQTQNQENQGEYGSGFEIARRAMSMVAEKVGELLSAPGFDDEMGIGEQVREVAQEQVQAQNQIQSEIKKIEQRSGFGKLILGPDYKAIKNVNMQMEQNELRIRELEQIQNEVKNQADETMLQETVNLMKEMNLALKEQVQAEERVGSLFGWLIRLFVN